MMSGVAVRLKEKLKCFLVSVTMTASEDAHQRGSGSDKEKVTVIHHLIEEP